MRQVVVYGFMFCLLIGNWRLVQRQSASSHANTPPHFLKSQQPPKRRHTTSAVSCPQQSLSDLREMNLLKSQSQEDEELLNYFNGLCGGTYIEIGALDGIKYSNSYVFHEALDWRGFLAELSPVSHQQLVQNRPQELVTPVNAAICGSEAQELHWVQRPELSEVNGIWEFANEGFRQHYWRGISLDQTQPITCKPLNTLLEEHVPETIFFDFFSLDIEGAEFVALEHFDFTKIGFGVIIIEIQDANLRKEWATRMLLEQNGYRHVRSFNRNAWYINADFAHIYRNVLVQ